MCSIMGAIGVTGVTGVTEWGVVVVIIALVGLIGTIVKPIINLNTAMTRLTTLLEGLTSSFQDMDQRNTVSHDRICKRLDDDEDLIGTHEKRITILETKDMKKAYKPKNGDKE